MFNQSPKLPPTPEPIRAVRADLAVHLRGPHTTEAVCMARSVLLVMPSARIRISHPQPAYAAYTAWSEALPLAAELFGTNPDTRPHVPEPGADIAGHLHFASEVRAASVDAFTAVASPTGTPQIRVHLGGLLIIAADAEAVISQASVWTTAYRHAAQLWPELPPLASLDTPRTIAQPVNAAA